MEKNVGDKVWWATCGTKEIEEVCPVCFGKRVVTVILGNEEHIQTPCDYCGKGFEGAKGYVTRYSWVSEVRQITITGKEVNESDTGRKVEYRYLNYCLDDTNVFLTKEEADARIAVLIDEHEKEESARLLSGKYNNNKSYSWHVGYHQRGAKEAKRQLEYHEQKVINMKKLAKLTVTE